METVTGNRNPAAAKFHVLCETMPGAEAQEEGEV